jgi:hypothetical protein
MNRFVAIVAVTLLAGCAATPPVTPTAQEGSSFRGEVWTWDERESIVTLRSGGQFVRVRTTPDQVRGLRLGEYATLRGELAPPAEIAHTTTPPRPVRAIPEGASVSSEVSGTVSANDPKGLVTIDAQPARITVWTATADTSQFPVGTPVRVKTVVQPVRYVSADDTGGAAPAASVPTTEVGEHAVVTGRILSVDPRGAISVESPRGPIAVLAPNASGLAVGNPVQVRTSLVRAR